MLDRRVSDQRADDRNHAPVAQRTALAKMIPGDDAPRHTNLLVRMVGSEAFETKKTAILATLCWKYF